jgi:ribonuclease E
VAIDFIDMKRESHIKAVQDRLVECLREDKARMEVGKINRFGVLIMTRQRIRPSIHHVTHESCPTCQGLGKVKNLDSMVLSVTRRIKAMLSRDDLKELRIKLAPAIAMGVLNAKRRELADLEELGEVQIRIEADASVPYGEMVAELERAEEEVAEKAAPQAKPRPKDREEDTVVLGGDSPITFDDALGTDDAARPAEKRAWGGASRPAHGALAGEDKPKAKPVEIKYDRRDAQRAALEERERLRALFESAMPVEDAEGTPEAAAEAEPRTEPAGGGKSRNRRGRGKSAAKAAGSGEAVPVMEPQPPVQVADTPMPEPPKVTPDILASLVVPVHRPKKLAPAEVAPAAAEAAAQRSATKAKPAKPAARAKAPAAAAPEPANEAGKAKPAKPPAKPAKPAADAAASKPRKKASKP